MLVLNVNELLPGDLIMVRSATKGGRAIRAFDEGDYSHVVVKVAQLFEIEANTSKGVHIHKSENLYKMGNRVFQAFPGAVEFDVLRLKYLKPSSSEADRFFREIVDVCVSYAGVPYSDLERLFGTQAKRVPGLLKQGAELIENRRGRHELQKGYFCSELASKLYSDASISLVPGSSPEKNTPNMIACSPLLKSIRADILSEIAESKMTRFSFRANEELERIIESKNQFVPLMLEFRQLIHNVESKFEDPDAAWAYIKNGDDNAEDENLRLLKRFEYKLAAIIDEMRFSSVAALTGVRRV